jgi:uncharacterized protein YbjT (DUF2867 family)
MNLVVGSTGLLGGMIARSLVEKGKPVRVLARTGATDIPGAEAVLADLKDRASLDKACRGVKTVITTANSAQRGGDDNVASVDVQGNINIIDAAKAAGVGHFIFISAAHVDEASPLPLFAAKARTERYLRDSGVPWTIVAPHAFMEVWFPTLIGSALGAGKPVALVGGGTKRHSFIAVGDVAAFAVACVDNPSALGQRLLLGGPEALSFRDLAAKAGEIAGRTIPTEVVQPGAPIPTLPPPLDQVIGNLAAALEMQDVIIDSSDIARQFGVRQTTAADVLRRVLS